MSQNYRCPNPECPNPDYGPDDIAELGEEGPPWTCDQCQGNHELVALSDPASPTSESAVDQEPANQVEQMSSGEAESSGDPQADETGKKEVQSIASARPPRPSAGVAGFAVEIKGPRSLDSSGNLVITANIACSSPTTSGRVWLEERDSNHRGPSIEFIAPRATDASSWSQTCHLKIEIESAGSTTLSLIIENDEDPNYCWRGDFAVQAERASNQPIHIDLSENITSGGDLFGGISERNVTIPDELAKHLSRAGDFREFRVFRCPKKQLIPVRRHEQHRNCQLTLASFDPETGTNWFWVLLGGREASFGRSKSSNDVVLKPQDVPANSPISRKHYLVRLTGDGPRLQFYTTKNGSTLIRDLDPPEYIPLNNDSISAPIALSQTSVSTVFPGAELNMVPTSLGLSYYPISRPDWVTQYEHLKEPFGLGNDVSTDPLQPHGFEIIRNDDVTESYYLFDAAIMMGSHPGTTIRHGGLQLRHARILLIDGSLWIEKHVPDASLYVNQRELRLNELHVLSPGDMIRAGNAEFEVTSRVQHRINCNCCR